jgi:hypothetical protein
VVIDEMRGVRESNVGQEYGEGSVMELRCMSHCRSVDGLAVACT